MHFSVTHTHISTDPLSTTKLKPAEPIRPTLPAKPTDPPPTPTLQPKKKHTPQQTTHESTQSKLPLTQPIRTQPTHILSHIIQPAIRGHQTLHHDLGFLITHLTTGKKLWRSPAKAQVNVTSTTTTAPSPRHEAETTLHGVQKWTENTPLTDSRTFHTDAAQAQSSKRWVPMHWDVITNITLWGKPTWEEEQQQHQRGRWCHYGSGHRQQQQLGI